MERSGGPVPEALGYRGFFSHILGGFSMLNIMSCVIDLLFFMVYVPIIF